MREQHKERKKNDIKYSNNEAIQVRKANLINQSDLVLHPTTPSPQKKQTNKTPPTSINPTCK